MNPLTLLCLVGVILSLARSIFTRWRASNKASQLGCLPPPNRLKAWWDPLGILVIRGALKARAEHRLVTRSLEGFQEVGRLEGRHVNTMAVHTVLTDTILTFDPRNIQAILATQFADYELPKHRLGTFERLLGSGIFSSNGARWQHSRALLKPAFSKGQISDVSLQDKHCRNLMLALPVSHGGWTDGVDLQPLFFRLTMDSSTEMLFGESVDSQLYELPASQRPEGLVDRRTQAESDFAGAFDRAQFGIAIKSAFAGLHWVYDPKGYDKACRDCHTFIDHYVQIALQKEPGKLDPEKGDKYVFLDELARETRDPVELRSQLISILLAGRDTTASLLAHLFALLARHPRNFALLRQAILEDFGSDTTSTNLTFSSLKSCQYLQYCLNETLRLFPSVPLNSRMANKDTTLPVGGGPDGMSPVFVSQGTNIGYSVAAMHRDVTLWGNDAKDFKPERWKGRVSNWSYLPFNGGPRICLGQQFALTSAGFAAVRLLQRFGAIENLDPTLDILEHLTLTSCPANGVRVRLREAND